jgi:putative transposase
MSKNYYSEINLHITWHTKLSAPLLTGRVETLTHQFIRQKLINTLGAFIHEIGGTDNHIHLAITIAPTILISDLVGKLRGASSHDVNQRLGTGQKILEWQPGYGVVSFGNKDLGWVKAYIRDQQRHHAQGKVQDRLEWITLDVDSEAENENAAAQADGEKPRKRGYGRVRASSTRPQGRACTLCEKPRKRG